MPELAEPWQLEDLQQHCGSGEPENSSAVEAEEAPEFRRSGGGVQEPARETDRLEVEEAEIREDPGQQVPGELLQGGGHLVTGLVQIHSEIRAVGPIFMESKININKALDVEPN